VEAITRVHLGSGRHSWPNAVNVDYDERADIVGPVDRLPTFEDESVDEIYAIHLFEHLERLKIGEALGEWRRVLKKGGKLILEMPCLDKIAQMLVEGETNIKMTLFGIFGDVTEPSPYMRHQWCYTIKELQAVLEANGFAVEVTDAIYHVPTRDMRATAIKL
jgi:predicted SAM-dependent methyltransferase